MCLIEEYNVLMSLVAKEKRKYIHSQSLHNFIIQLSKSKSNEDFSEIKKGLNEYMEVVKENVEDIDSKIGLNFFQMYVNPIGESLIKYGFTRITPLRFLFLYSVMIDSLLYIAFFRFPYPVISFGVLIYYLLFRMRKQNENKVYGLFY
jgi:hypothetical protein